MTLAEPIDVSAARILERRHVRGAEGAPEAVHDGSGVLRVRTGSKPGQQCDEGECSCAHESLSYQNSLGAP